MDKMLLPIIAIALIFGFFMLKDIIFKKKKLMKTKEKPGEDATKLPIGVSKAKKEKRGMSLKFWGRPKETAEVTKAKAIQAITNDVSVTRGLEDTENESNGEIPETIEDYGAVKAYVYNDITGRCAPAILTGEEVKVIVAKHGTLGRPREHNGVYRYFFNYSKKGYAPTLFPWSPDNSSGHLHRALTHPEIPIIYDVEPERTFAQKYGMYLLFAGVVIFLMWTSVYG